MDRSTSYDDDIYAWSQEQAAALRRLAETRRDLPNELDLEHVAEEVEDLGRSELRTARGFARLLLLHLVKLASAPQARSVEHWQSEVETFQADLVDSVTRAMEPQFDLQKSWRLALSKAAAELHEQGDDLAPDLPRTCPFSLSELVAEPFDLDGAVRRLLGRDGRGPPHVI